MIYSLTYLSRSLIDQRGLSDELAGILAHAQRRNAGAGITGALMAGDGCFVQTLEGPRSVVDRVYARIAADPRHTDLQLLGARPEGGRRFANWSMALVARGDELHSALTDLLWELKPQIVHGEGNPLLSLMSSMVVPFETVSNSEEPSTCPPAYRTPLRDDRYCRMQAVEVAHRTS